MLLDRATQGDPDSRRPALIALGGASADPEVRALLLDRATHDDDKAARAGALRALRVASADPEVRALLLDRAAHEDDTELRLWALVAFGLASADPEVRALLLDRATHENDQNVWRAVLDLIASNNSEDPILRVAVSEGANRFGSDLVRQLTARIASCSAEFTPDSLPITENGHGISLDFVCH